MREGGGFPDKDLQEIQEPTREELTDDLMERSLSEPVPDDEAEAVAENKLTQAVRHKLFHVLWTSFMT